MQYYTNKKLNEITKEIVDLMPPLGPFFNSSDNIKEASKKLYEYEATSLYLKRQKSFLNLVKKKVDRLFNDGEKKNINILGEENKGLKGGVVDHHGILNHPALFGVNFVSNYFRMFDRKKNGDFLTFATGNVPLNDYFHRRGFFLGGNKVNLFKKADKNKMVYCFPKHNFNFVESLKQTYQWVKHSDPSKDFLIKIEDAIKEIDFSTCRTLGDQLTKINFHLWPMLFCESARRNIANLISLEYDDIVSDYLIHVIKNDSGSFISQMLFNNEYRDKVLDFFEGETGAWDKKRGTGTVFFWGRSSENFRLKMELEKNQLISEDSSLKIAWSKDSIIKELENRNIFPGMFLKFSLILFYMGMKPFAGFGSGNYLFNTQQKVINFLSNDYPQEVENIKTVTTNNVTSISIALKRNSKNEIGGYYAFDIIKDGGLSEKYLKDINSVPLRNFMAPNLQFIYGYAFNLYGKGKKKDFSVAGEDFESLYKGIL